MKKFKKIFQTIFVMTFVLLCGVMFAGCGDKLTITSIDKTSTSGYVDTYTITYSNGETSTFTVTNGKNGTDGKDGTSVSISEIYEKYVEEYGDISYQDFLKQYSSSYGDAKKRHHHHHQHDQGDFPQAQAPSQTN